MSVVADVALGVVVAVATCLDEVFLLVAFLGAGFARVGVMAGYLAALTVVLGASAGLGTLAQQVIDVRWLGVLPIALGVKELFLPEDERVGSSRRRGPLTVALVMLANGGEELAVYAALFAPRAPAAITVLAATQLAFAALLVAFADRLVAHPRIGPALRPLSRWVLPWLLVALGVLVLGG